MVLSEGVELTNALLYPRLQEYLRGTQVPLFAVWERGMRSLVLGVLALSQRPAQRRDSPT